MVSNVIGFRLGQIDFWKSYWYHNFNTYTDNFYKEHQIKLYFFCLCKKLNIRVETYTIKFLGNDINLYLSFLSSKNKEFIRKRWLQERNLYLYFFKYHYFLKILTKTSFNIKNLVKWWILKNSKRKIRFKKRFKKYFLFYKTKQKFKYSLKYKLLERFFKYQSQIWFPFYRLNFFFQQNKEYFFFRNIYISAILIFQGYFKHTLSKILFRLNIITKKKIRFFFINLNTMFILGQKNKMYSYLLNKLENCKRYKYYYNIVYISEISLTLKNPQFFLDFIALQLRTFTASYYILLNILKKIFKSYMHEKKYLDYILGIRFKISGKVKGRKKNQATYLLLSFGKLLTTSFEADIKYSINFGATPFGVLGLKFWVTYNKNDIVQFSYRKKQYIY